MSSYLSELISDQFKTMCTKSKSQQDFNDQIILKSIRGTDDDDDDDDNLG